QECNRRSFARQGALDHRHSDRCGAQWRAGRAISANEETGDCAEVPQDGVIPGSISRAGRASILARPLPRRPPGVYPRTRFPDFNKSPIGFLRISLFLASLDLTVKKMVDDEC